jgi:MerR family transcriptional regulator, thiopeptide resistance regulator
MKAEPLLPIGEVSRRTRLSERALRLYEQEGLVSPARSANGRRAYAMADLRRLQQVQILRRAGYSLADIRTLLSRRDFDAAESIALQLDGLRAEQLALSRSIGLLEAAQSRLQGGEALDAEALCDLIRLAERSIEEENWRQTLSLYWTDEDQERWKVAMSLEYTPERCAAIGRDWGDLVGRIEKAMARNTPPDSDAAIGLGQEWMVLQRPYMEVLPDLWPKTVRMYAEMDRWAHRVTPPFSKAVLDYMRLAVAAGRAKGVIAPSKYTLDAEGNPILKEDPP